MDKGSHSIQLDERTGRTVIEIVKGFLTKRGKVVVYVCDSADGRELLRKRKFDQWFRKYDDGSVIKIDGHINVPDVDIYNAILIHKDNSQKNKFIEAFNQNTAILAILNCAKLRNGVYQVSHVYWSKEQDQAALNNLLTTKIPTTQ